MPKQNKMILQIPKIETKKIFGDSCLCDIYNHVVYYDEVEVNVEELDGGNFVPYVGERRGIDYNYSQDNVKQAVLEKIKFGIADAIPHNLAEMYRINGYYEDYGKGLHVRLERGIASLALEEKTLEVSVTLRCPSNWFQHLKWDFRDILPEWFLEKYPVKFLTETKSDKKTFKVREAYPNLPMLKDQQVVYFIDGV